MLAGVVGLVVPATAMAAPGDIVPYVAEFQDCNEQTDNCGPRGENDGPGFEQSIGTSFAFNGKTYLAWVGMSSKNIPNRGQGPYQCRGYVASIDAINGLTIEVDGLLLTNNQGNRPCNHPDIVYAGADNLLFCYGTNDANNANVQWYGQVLGLNMVAKAGRTRLSDNNGNDGAGTCRMVLDANMQVSALPTTFYTVYNDNGDNMDGAGATINANFTITKNSDTDAIIDPANIPRGFLAQYSPTHFLACSARGDQRPPEDGNYCRTITVAGNKVGRQQAVLETNENVNPRIYANSIKVQTPKAYGDIVYTLNTTSSGTGRNNNNNGATNVYLDALRVGPDNILSVVARTPVGQLYGGTHSAMCTGSFGPDGLHSALLIQGTISGSGPGVATPYTFDSATNAFTAGPLKVTTSGYSDVAELANEYGNNPNTQGRDFISCVGDIPNPGYGVTGGFMPEVQTFFAVFNQGKNEAEDYKNSAVVTLFPGHTPDIELPPDSPPENPDDDVPGNDDPDDPGTGVGGGSGASGGCSVASNGQGAASLVLILGAMVLVVRRRRRR
jgi:MYXO-CTERM domain-containing protein